MSPSRYLSALGLALAAACVLALAAVFAPRAGGTKPGEPPAALRVAWRVPLSARADRPCPVAEGWVVADAAGGVIRVSSDGRVLWRAAFSNEAFAGAVELPGNRIALAAEGGRVFGLDLASGATNWVRETGARFQQAPVAGSLDAEAVLWLVSQEDGRLFCLRAADGAVVWAGEPTNRCDGELAAWRGLLAYGNCDGAVYVFGAADGKLRGSVSVGDEDQMAGGMLALPDGWLATGTRQGSLVLIDPVALACVARVKVSEGEAFVTPVADADGRVVMGNEEGDVTWWSRSGKALAPAGRTPLGAPVRDVRLAGARLFALAGGELCELGGAGRPAARRLALGDDVGRLAAHADGTLACVADGALVCVKGGGG